MRVFPDTSSGRTDGVQAQLMANASEVQNVYVGLEVTIIAGAGFLDLCLPSLICLCVVLDACKRFALNRFMFPFTSIEYARERTREHIVYAIR